MNYNFDFYNLSYTQVKDLEFHIDKWWRKTSDRIFDSVTFWEKINGKIKDQLYSPRFNDILDTRMKKMLSGDTIANKFMEEQKKSIENISNNQLQKRKTEITKYVDYVIDETVKNNSNGNRVIKVFMQELDNKYDQQLVLYKNRIDTYFYWLSFLTLCSIGTNFFLFFYRAVYWYVITFLFSKSNNINLII
jgi:hypothetical protein